MYIPLHRQNDRTSNNIKHINSMKALELALELKDLKEGNIYKRVEEDDTLIYVQVLSEGDLATCNYVYILLDFDRSKICISEIRKSCYLPVAQGYKGYYLSIAQGAFTPCTQKEFKAAIKMIKDSLTF